MASYPRISLPACARRMFSCATANLSSNSITLTFNKEEVDQLKNKQFPLGNTFLIKRSKKTYVEGVSFITKLTATGTASGTKFQLITNIQSFPNNIIINENNEALIRCIVAMRCEHAHSPNYYKIIDSWHKDMDNSWHIGSIRTPKRGSSLIFSAHIQLLAMCMIHPLCDEAHLTLLDCCKNFEVTKTIKWNIAKHNKPGRYHHLQEVIGPSTKHMTWYPSLIRKTGKWFREQYIKVTLLRPSYDNYDKTIAEVKLWIVYWDYDNNEEKMYFHGPQKLQFMDKDKTQQGNSQLMEIQPGMAPISVRIRVKMLKY